MLLWNNVDGFNAAYILNSLKISAPHNSNPPFLCVPALAVTNVSNQFIDHMVYEQESKYGHESSPWIIFKSIYSMCKV